jgi:hydroxymethylpyrimidine/phosphomethylpyrimidine kinase
MKASCVLAVGGLDPGGGAGILADARAIVRGGAFPCAVVAVQTVQSTRGLARAEPVAARLWVEQARRVLADQRVGAIKTGALGSAANVRAAARLLARHPRLPAVVDPVMLPTRGGAALLARSALAAMRRELVPRAALVTANAAEAEALTGLRVRDAGDARDAARALVAIGARAALVKGGHLSDARAIDVLATRDRVIELAAPRLRLRRPVHGAGCLLASLIAARLATGHDVVAAVRFAKRVHHALLAHPLAVGGPLAVLAATSQTT